MVMGYWSVAFLFWQLSIDHTVNVLKSYIKDVDLTRHAWDTPPFLLIVSPTPPVQSVDAYVRSVNHVTTKRKKVDHIPWVWRSYVTLRACALRLCKLLSTVKILLFLTRVTFSMFPVTSKAPNLERLTREICLDKGYFDRIYNYGTFLFWLY